MWTIPTGRQRTLHLSGTIGGVIRYKLGEFGLTDPFGNCIGGSPAYFAGGTIEIRFPPCSVVVETGPVFPLTGTPGFRDIGPQVNVGGLSSASACNVTHMTPPYDYTGTYDGTWDMSLDTEECLEVRKGDVYGDFGFDIFGNAIYIYDDYQPPAYTIGKFYERLRVGGTVAVTATAGGATASVSDPITMTGGPMNREKDVQFTITGFGENTVNAMSASLSFLGNESPAAINVSDAYSSVVVGGNVLTATCNPPTAGLTWCDDVTANVYCAATIGQNLTYELDGVVRTITGPYPNNLGFVIDRAADQHLQPVNSTVGTLTDTHTQVSWGVTAGLNGGGGGTVGPGSTYYRMQVKVRPGTPGDGDANSLLALMEDDRDTRVLLRAMHPWAVTDVSQSGTALVDNGNALTVSTGQFDGHWEAEAHTTISHAGGEIVAVVAGGSGEVRRIFNPGTVLFVDFDGTTYFNVIPRTNAYRYMDVTLRSTVDGSPVTLIAVGGKKWNRDYQGNPLVADVASRTWRIDLCSPSNSSAASDPQDSAYPLRVAVDARYPFPSDGPYWGITGPVYIGFSDLRDGVTYKFDNIALVRKTFSKLWVLPEFEWIVTYVYIAGSPPTIYYRYGRRLVLACTDGKQSFEWFDAFDYTTLLTTPPRPPGMAGYQELPIFYVANQLLAIPGWNATNGTGLLPADVPDGSSLSAWMNPNRPAAWLQGGGMMWQDGAWVYTNDLDVSSTKTLYGQPLFDVIETYAGCGDCCAVTDWSFGPTVKFRPAYMLRGGGYGLIFGEDGLPINAQAVTVKDLADDSDAGNVSTDVQGYYRTGVPFAKGLHNIRTSIPGTQYDRVWINAKRKRLCLSHRVVDYRCVECDSVRAWMHIGDGKKIKTFNLNDWSEAFESDDYAIDHWVKLRTDRRWGNLIGLSKRGGSYQIFVSTDGGQTGTEVLSVATNSAGIERDSTRNISFLFWGDGSDHIYMQQSSDGGDTWGDPTPVSIWNDPALDDLIATLEDFTWDERTGILVMLCKIGTSQSVLQSEDLGYTWTLVLH